MFFFSEKDTVVALEALAEYEIKKPRPEGNIEAVLTIPGKTDSVTIALMDKKEKVEADLKVFEILDATHFKKSCNFL